jgi:transposase
MGVISDEFWAAVESVMPSDEGKRGNRFGEHRLILEGIAWRFRTGSPWRVLPADVGPWQTVWKRHHRWSLDGTYAAMLAQVAAVFGFDAGMAEDLEKLLSVDSTNVRAHQHGAGARSDTLATGALSNYKKAADEPDDHAIGRSRGGLTTKIHALTDPREAPVAVRLTAGQAGDNPQLVPLLDDYAAACKQQGASGRDFRLLGDKAYSHPSTRTELRSRRIKHTIPQRSDQIARRKAKGSTGGRPPAFDAALYGLRNTVERGFNRLKQWRGVATRYDKYALTYLGGVLLACAVIHARVGATELGDTP